MSDQTCTCPKITKDGHVVRAHLDVNCRMHGQESVQAHRVHQNCPTCKCREPDEREPKP